MNKQDFTISQTGNKRIAKNTMLLYLRMLLLLGINLYAARIILQALGTSDYGLYNVVGGIVTIFSVINGTLSSGTSRFLTFELGGGNFEKLRNIFSAAFTLHACVALIVLILSETIGLWFLNTQLVIPPDRIVAANWVYQFSIVSCILSLTQIPYSASIISHERMDVYAYVGLAEGGFKLVNVFILLHASLPDKLICYGFLMMSWSILLQIYYRFYCLRNFKESSLVFIRDKNIYKKMLSFSLWDTGGALGGMLNTQGLNFLLNIFFGLAANAARGIAVQVDTQLQMFYINFMTAVTPQIVKCYAVKDYKRFFELIFESSKYSYFLLLVVTLPVFMECEYILGLWLVEVPYNTVLFLRWIMFMELGRAMARPVINGVHASGNIKYLNLYTSFVLLTIPLSYVAFKLGFSAVASFIINGILLWIANIVELYTLKKEVNFSMMQYIRQVMFKCFAVTALIIIIPILIIHVFEPSFIRLCLSVFVDITCVSVGVFFLILNKDQRSKLLTIIRKRINGNNKIK